MDTTRRAPKSFPLLTAIAATVMLAAGAHGASAKEPAPNAVRELPVTTAPQSAFVIVEEIPFNKFVRLNCNSTNTTCSTRLPAVPHGERMAIQFISCNAQSAIDGQLQYFELVVIDAQFTKQVGFHYLAPSYRSPDPPYSYVVSQPIVLGVAPTNVVQLAAVSIGGIANVACALSGVRQKLEVE